MNKRKTLFICLYVIGFLTSGFAQSDYSFSYGQAHFSNGYLTYEFADNTRLIASAGRQTGVDQFSFRKWWKLDGTLNITFGIDISGEDTHIDILVPGQFQNQSVARNFNPRTRVTLPADLYVGIWKFSLIFGVESNFYFKKKDASITVSTTTDLWADQEIVELEEALDAFKNFSIGYRYGILLKPVKRIGLELVFSQQLSNPVETINFKDVTLRPDFRYRSVSARISYFFSIKSK